MALYRCAYTEKAQKYILKTFYLNVPNIHMIRTVSTQAENAAQYGSLLEDIEVCKQNLPNLYESFCVILTGIISFSADPVWNRARVCCIIVICVVCTTSSCIIRITAMDGFWTLCTWNRTTTGRYSLAIILVIKTTELLRNIRLECAVHVDSFNSTW